MKQIRLIIGGPSQSPGLPLRNVLHADLVGAYGRNRVVSLYLHSPCLFHTLSVFDVVWLAAPSRAG